MALTLTVITDSSSPNGFFQAKGINDASGVAQSIFCNFTPRWVVVENVTDSIHDEWDSTMANGVTNHTVAAGTRTNAVANGVTPLTGAEVAPAAAAVGSPASAGSGFSMSTGVILASKTYSIRAYR